MAVTSGTGWNKAATAQLPLPLLLAVLSLLPRSTYGQAVPRTDTPRAGTLRVTFEPVITTWDRECTSDGDVVCRYLFTPVFVHVERRVTPLALEFGITSRLAVGAKVPLVRVN